MNNEINNAVELSLDELDTVAGGATYSSDGFNNFLQNNLVVGQQTFAGPGGSGTVAVSNLQQVTAGAGLGIGITL
jgi:hypothetical protein